MGSIPTELSGCTALEELYLQENKLWGKIPDSLRALRGLRYLYLHRVSRGNAVSGDLLEVSTFRSLLHLDTVVAENTSLFP